MDEKLTPDISIIIVSYKCLPVLKLALASVRNAIGAVNAEVIVVDNASFDGTAQIIQSQYKWVRFIESIENVGFSRANNIALERCTGKIVLLLNPDTIVPQGFVLDIMRHFNDNPQSGAVGVHMVNGEGRYLRESKRGYPDVLTSFFKFSSLWRLAPKSKTINQYYLGHLPDDKPCAAPVLSGACMAFRRTLMEKVGTFDPEYFMYGEDIDLSWRMHKASEGNIFRGDLRIVHFKGASTPLNVSYIFYFYDAMVKFANRHEFKSKTKLTGIAVGISIRLLYLLAVLKCYVRKFLRLFQSEKLPKQKILVTGNAEHAERFAVLFPGETVGTLALDGLKPMRKKTVIFDITNDISAVINYMEKNAGKNIYGFYSSEDDDIVVYKHKCINLL